MIFGSPAGPPDFQKSYAIPDGQSCIKPFGEGHDLKSDI